MYVILYFVVSGLGEKFSFAELMRLFMK